MILDTSINAQDDKASTKEDAPTAASGSVITNDDHADGETVAATSPLVTKHGVYTLKPDGHYTFTVNAASQSLAEGESAKDTLTYELTDKAGNKTTATLTTIIHGTNDAPVLHIDKHSNMQSGTFTEKDVDTHDTHTFSGTHTGTYGELIVNPNGSYTFAQNSNIQGMTLGTNGVYTAQEKFAIKVIDHHGGTDTKYITFDVAATVVGGGPNQPPIVQPVAPSTAPGSTPHVPALSSTGPAGVSGTTSANTNAVTIDLAAKSDSGSSHTDDVTNDKTPEIKGHTTIPFSEVKIYEGHNLIATTRSDKNGHYSVQTHDLGIDNTYHLTATAQEPAASSAVHGAQPLDMILDTTISALDDKASTKEDAPTAASGSVITNDDHADGETVKATSPLVTAHGVYTLKPDGHYTFTVNAAYQSLAEGESAKDTLTYEITDRAGNKTTATLTTTIHGTNDAPVLHIDKHSNMQSGTFTETDVDKHDTHDFSGSHTGTYGTLTVNPNGSYTFAQNSNIQGMTLANGVYTAQEKFAIKVIDHHGGEDIKYVTFDVGATVGAGLHGPVVTLGVPTAPGSTPHVPALSSTGPAGVSGTTSANTNAVTIDLAAKSDSGSSDTDDVTRDKTPEIKGHTTIPFSEVKIYEGNTLIATTHSNAQGHYSVVTSDLVHDGDHPLTATAQGPGASSAVSGAQPLHVILDTSINAQDDKASTKEDAPTAASGSVITNDDHADGETVKATSPLVTAHGVYTLKPDGHYTFTVNAAYQSLAEGESAKDTLTYELTDKAGNKTTATLTTTIHGTNDAPVLHIDKHSNMQSGTFTETDVDKHDTHDFSGSHTGTYGTLTVNPNGSYTFAQNSNIQGMTLANGVYTAQEKFAIKVIDHHGGEDIKYVTFDVGATVGAGLHGPVVTLGVPTAPGSTPHVPALSSTGPAGVSGTTSANTNAVTIDLAAKSDSGSSDTDDVTRDKTPEIKGHTTIPFSEVKIYEGNTLIATTHSNAQGHYSVVTSDLVHDGDHPLTATAQGPGASSAVSGAQPLHVILDTSINAQDDKASTKEDAPTAASGSVITNDDHADGETVKATSPLVTAHGVYTLKPDGHYTFTVNAAYQSLAEGESAKDTLTYELTDKAGNKTTATLTTTIHGTNDAPVLHIDKHSNMQSGTFTETDVDKHDTHDFSGSHTGTYGTLTVNPNGSYTFAQNSNIQGMTLANGVYTAQEKFAIKVIDHHGGEDIKYVTFDVGATVGAGLHGPVVTLGVPTAPGSTPHVPALSSTGPAGVSGTTTTTNAVTIDLAAKSDSGSSDTDDVTKDRTPTITGTTTIPFSEVKIYEGNTVIATTHSNAQGHYSVVTHDLGGDGKHPLTATAQEPGASSAVSGAQPLHVILDTSINAQDDKASIDEDAPTASIKGNVITDATTGDDKDGTHVTNMTQQGTSYGAYHIYADGSYTYTLDNSKSAVQQLGVNEIITDTIEYEITDKAGNKTTATLTTTIHGTNDDPVLHIDQHSNMQHGTFTETDVDKHDTHDFSGTHTGTYGTLTVNPNGSYTFAQNSNIQGMTRDPGTGVYSTREAFAITVIDHHGGTDTKYVTIDIAANVTGLNPTTGVPIVVPVTSPTPVPPLSSVNPNAVSGGTGTGTGSGIQHSNANDVSLDLIDSSDSGVSDSDNLTKVRTPTITGITTIPFSEVKIYEGNTLIATTHSDKNGHYSVQTHDLGIDNTYHLTATAQEPAASSAVHGAQPLHVILDTSINAQDDTASTNEDASKAASGSVITNDDHADGETVKATSPLVTKHGVYTLDSNGHYTFTVNAAYQSLAEGESANDTLTYEITDRAGNKTTATLTTTIHGTNDDPVLHIDQHSNMQHGTFTEKDVDTHDTHTFSGTHTGTYGELTVNPDGSYTFTQNSNIQGMTLANGVYTAQEKFAIKVIDHHGGEDIKYVTFDVGATVGAGLHGPVVTLGVPTAPGSTPHVPALSSTGPAGVSGTTTTTNAVTIDLAAKSDSGSSDTDDVTKDRTPTITGTTTIPFSEVKIYEGNTVIATTHSNAQGHYSVVTHDLGGDGKHPLTATAQEPGASSAVSGAQPLHVILDTSINAQDDKASIDEDAPTASIKGNVITDATTGDDKDGTHVTNMTQQGTSYGAYHIYADGSYTYTLDNSKSAVQQLGVNEIITDTIEYEITDKAGNKTTATLTTTIHGTNDDPVLHIDQHSNMQHGTFTETDVDKHDTHDFSGTHTGTYGTLTVNPNGSYTFAQNSNIQGMTRDPGTGVYSTREAFAITVIDHHGGTDTKYVTIDIAANVTGLNPTTGVPIVVPVTSPTPVPPLSSVNPNAVSGGTGTGTGSGTQHSNANDVSLDLIDSSDSGVSDSDNLTKVRTPTITGITTIPFSEVKIYEGNTLIATTRSNAKGDYSVVTHDLGREGSHTLTATVKEPAASLAVSGTHSLDVTLDTSVSIEITEIDDSRGLIATGGHPVHGTRHPAHGANHPHFGVNQADTGELTVHGTVSYVEDGQTIKVTLHGRDYTTTVSGGTWQLTLQANQVTHLPDGDYDVSASVTDKAGNKGSTLVGLAVDQSTPSISIDAISTDNVMNAAEHKQPLIITGKTDAEVGQPVIITVNGVGYPATVIAGTGTAGNTFSTSVNAAAVGQFSDGATLHVIASVNNNAGNPSLPATADVSVDITATIRIDALSTGDVINAAEHKQSLTISGTTTGVEDGRTVTIHLNGVDYTAKVDSTGGWTVPVTAAGVQGLNTGGPIDFTADVTDRAGNPATDHHQLTVNETFSGTATDVDITDPGSDDIINNNEKGNAEISGQIDPRTTLTTLTITDSAGTAHVIDLHPGQVHVDPATGAFTVSGVDVSHLPDGVLTVTATSTDKVGNVSTATDQVTLDTTPPVIHINDISNDDVINAAEHKQPLIVTGTTDAEVGQQVTVTVGTQSYHVNVLAGHTFSVSVPAAQVAAFRDDSDVAVTANVSDRAGNAAIQAHHHVGVDLTAIIDFYLQSDDNVLDKTEAHHDFIFKGFVKDVEAGQIVTLTIAGQTVTGVVDNNNHWSVHVPAAIMSSVPGGTQPIEVSITDRAGNPAGYQDQIFIKDATHTPPLSGFVHTPLPTGGAPGPSAHPDQWIRGQMHVPDYLRHTGGEFAIQTAHGPENSITTPFGVLTIDAVTGQMAYHYVNRATPGAKLAGGQHTAGQEEHYPNTGEVYGILYRGVYISDVAIKIDVWKAFIHGKSGQGTDNTALKSMDLVAPGTGGSVHDAPAPPPPDADVFVLDASDLLAAPLVDAAHVQKWGFLAADGRIVNEMIGEHGTAHINPETGEVTYTYTKSSVSNEGAAVAAHLVSDQFEVVTNGITTGNFDVNMTEKVTLDADGNCVTKISNVKGTATPYVPPEPDNLEETTINVDTIDSDIIAAAAKAKTDVAITGDITGVANDGDVVTVTVNGTVYIGNVAEGRFSIAVPASVLLTAANLEVSIFVTSNGQQVAVVHQDIAYTVDSTADASITIDSISDDNVLNAAEIGGKVTVTGVLGGDVKDGDTITLHVNGKDFTGSVADGKYAIDVDGSDLAADSKVSARVTGTDAAGHVRTASAEHDYTVDTTLDAHSDVKADDSDSSAMAQSADAGKDPDASLNAQAASADTSKNAASTTGSGDGFDLGNAAALLDDKKADKAATATTEALEKAAGLLEEHPDSVEDKLVKLVENAPVKDPVPVEQTSPSQSADKTSEDGAKHEPQADHADYVPPPSHDDDDLHHDGTGLT